jgi:3'(2'),5'-bisphosphate nucleotidase
MAAYAAELDVARAAARAAGALIRAHYDAGTARPTAKADGSPVTQADLESNQEIVRRLAEAFPDDGILAEESPDATARLAKSRVWIVDPLDGTRDFVGRTGDFAVHIALAVDGRPVVSVVHAPASGRLWRAAAGQGAFEEHENGQLRPLRASSETQLERFRIGVSRLGVNANQRRFMAEHPLGKNTVAIGASLKMMALAGGELEISLCLTDYEREWDTCAPELIVREAGGRFTDLDGREGPGHGSGVASNGHVHDALLVLLGGAAARVDTVLG